MKCAPASGMHLRTWGLAQPHLGTSGIYNVRGAPYAKLKKQNILCCSVKGSLRTTAAQSKFAFGLHYSDMRHKPPSQVPPKPMPLANSAWCLSRATGCAGFAAWACARRASAPKAPNFSISNPEVSVHVGNLRNREPDARSQNPSPKP